VVELPEALQSARSLAMEAGISEVVEHREGDILAGNFGGVTSCDVVLLANILHHFGSEQNQAILARVHGLITAKGTVAIWDIERPGEGKPPELGRDASALYFRLTSASRCFSAEDYKGWLQTAGFADIRIVRPLAAPLHFLIHARR
jgi:2-polyprenyl-3-methyl-5-hydroxy-6-metoxy-1,4-benzoquinol methylase